MTILSLIFLVEKKAPFFIHQEDQTKFIISQCPQAVNREVGGHRVKH